MRPKVLHFMLAFLILFQSVSALAVMPFGSMPSDGPAQLVLDNADMPDSNMAGHGKEGSCHDQVVAAADTEQSHSCCDSMNGASCLLSCSSAAAALSTLNSLLGVNDHGHYAVVLYDGVPQKMVSGLFRPPRTI